MKKKIGISYTRSNFKNYWNWFTPQDLQDDIELVELSFEKNNTEDIYKCDGFVLTGGVDVHPSFYNGKKIMNNSPAHLNLERDRFRRKNLSLFAIKQFACCLGNLQGNAIDKCIAGWQTHPGP